MTYRNAQGVDMDGITPDHPTPQPPRDETVEEAVADLRRQIVETWLDRAAPDPDFRILIAAVRAETIRECREKVAELRPHYDGIFPYGRVAAKDVFAIFDALGGQP